MQALIVDDSKVMRTILRRLLVEAGFKAISEAANGVDALAALQQLTDPSLVLVDWNMPEMNGLDFVKAVRQEARFNGIRLLMVTTETELHQVSKALEAGANEYLMKPFTPDALHSKLVMMGFSMEESP